MDASSPSTPAVPTSHVWDRWLPLWHTVLAASLVLATLSALLSGGLTADELPVALGGVGLLAAGYWAMFVRRPPQAATPALALAYLAAIGLVWAVLLRQSGSYYWLQPILFSQVFFLIDARRLWLPPIAWVVGLGIQFQFEGDPRPLPELLPDVLSVVVMMGFFVLFAAWVGAIIEQSGERAGLIERLEATRRELAEREREAGVHEERERFARELHDTLAQDLMSIVTHLQAADSAPDPATAAKHRAEASRMAREGLAESRRIVWALRPELLERGTLVESLERTLEQWRASTGLAASLTVTGRQGTLHPDVEVTILRSVQEGLANAARHAAPRQVTVTLSYLGDVVTLDVHDDGRGFDPGRPVVRAGGGLGLVGMRERAERLGGSVAVESAPGEGTTIGLTLPALAVS